jgi:hypothetical protein
MRFIAERPGRLLARPVSLHEKVLIIGIGHAFATRSLLPFFRLGGEENTAV